jgi:hypothetical protein
VTITTTLSFKRPVPSPLTPYKQQLPKPPEKSILNSIQNNQKQPKKSKKLKKRKKENSAE